MALSCPPTLTSSCLFAHECACLHCMPVLTHNRQLLTRNNLSGAQSFSVADVATCLADALSSCVAAIKPPPLFCVCLCLKSHHAHLPLLSASFASFTSSRVAAALLLLFYSWSSIAGMTRMRARRLLWWQVQSFTACWLRSSACRHRQHTCPGAT